MCVCKLVPNYCNHLLHMTQFEAKSKKKSLFFDLPETNTLTKTNRIQYVNNRMGRKYQFIIFLLVKIACPFLCREIELVSEEWCSHRKKEELSST